MIKFEDTPLTRAVLETLQIPLINEGGFWVIPKKNEDDYHTVLDYKPGGAYEGFCYPHEHDEFVNSSLPVIVEAIHKTYADTLCNVIAPKAKTTPWAVEAVLCGCEHEDSNEIKRTISEVCLHLVMNSKEVVG